SRDGVIHLEGTVPSERQHQMVTELLQDVAGIGEVVDHLEVQRTSWENGDRPRSVPRAMTKVRPRTLRARAATRARRIARRQRRRRSENPASRAAAGGGRAPRELQRAFFALVLKGYAPDGTVARCAARHIVKRGPSGLRSNAEPPEARPAARRAAALR